jgi:hypothetical protein
MIAQLKSLEHIETENFSLGIGKNKKTVERKKPKTALNITIIKVRLFFWNLSPIHWYDTFKDIHVDMNEFISPKNKNKQK